MNHWRPGYNRRKNANSQLATESGVIERHEVTPDQVCMISNFQSRARDLRVAPKDQPSMRREKQAKYLNLLVDLSEKGDEFADRGALAALCEIIGQSCQIRKSKPVL